METNPRKQIGGLALIPSQSSEILSMLKNFSISHLLPHLFDPDSTDSLHAGLSTLWILALTHSAEKDVFLLKTFQGIYSQKVSYCQW